MILGILAASFQSDSIPAPIPIDVWDGGYDAGGYFDIDGSRANRNTVLPAQYRLLLGSTSVTSGKYYFEFQNCVTDSLDTSMYFGLRDSSVAQTTQLSTSPSSGENATALQVITGQSFVDGSSTVMIAFNASTGHIWWGLNGVWNGNPSTNSSPRRTAVLSEYRPAVTMRMDNQQVDLVTVSEWFKYDIPTGFTALDEEYYELDGSTQWVDITE